MTGDASSATFWSESTDQLFARLQATADGLTAAAAAQRLEQYGPNRLRERAVSTTWSLLLAQFRSPITLLLLAAAILSLIVGETTDGLIILAILIISGLLGFWQERGAAGALQRLLALVRLHATVLRDAQANELPADEVVPGDVVQLAAGDSVPADCRLLEAKDLFVDQAALTGESFPADKAPGQVSASAPLADRTNALFMGTQVVSGTGRALVVATGHGTVYGGIAQHLQQRPPETDFEHGIRRFGFMLLEITLVLVLFIFTVNVWLHRPPLDSLLFSLALAVGLTPQLLPAIVSITLASGARRLAKLRVIVRRLASIESFGSMNVLCTDKTGTLTLGVSRVDAVVDALGAPCAQARQAAFLNASFQSGYANPVDRTIRALAGEDAAGWRKLDEVPYDFVRKRLSVLVERAALPATETLMVTKGALANVLDVCDHVTAGGATRPLAELRAAIEQRAREASSAGLRCLGVASRALPAGAAIQQQDEQGMTFLGMLTLVDPLKEGVREDLQEIARLGIRLKVVTGDNRLVATRVAAQAGIPTDTVVTGEDLREATDAALRHLVDVADVFAEVEPNQKERIILALKKNGHAVGFLGDGINDAPALHAADVGISVESAVDVTRLAADIVLLEKDLGVLADGVREGRRAFANTLKYIFITTSASFGNMFSMAGASLFATFLPLLPKQILLINVLTDLPAMAIATDSLDPEMVEQPRRWDMRFIRNFMLTFGLVSSTFDYITFGVLLWLPLAVAQFRTGWFLESVLSELLILLVIRTRRPFFRSRPGRPLLLATAVVTAVTLALIYLPSNTLFGLTGLSPRLLGLLLLIVALYVLASEAAKRVFFRTH